MAIDLYRRGISELELGISIKIHGTNNDRALRLQSKMKTNLEMARDRLDFLSGLSDLQSLPLKKQEEHAPFVARSKSSSSMTPINSVTPRTVSSRALPSSKKTTLPISGVASVVNKKSDSPGINQAVKMQSQAPLVKPHRSNSCTATTIEKPSVKSASSIKGVDPKLASLILNEVVEGGAGVSFTDIAGLELAKQALQEIVILPSLRPELFTGLRSPARGLLLFGAPGNGKTMLARAVATESQATFFNISASSLTSKYVGEGEKLVRALFAVARELQPSIIFVDEIDSLMCERTSGEHDASRRLKTEFLCQFDGLNTSIGERILVMGATNRPQELDEAVLRRFPKRIYVRLPDEGTRIALLTALLSKHSNPLSDKQLTELAKLTSGYSNSDLTALAKDAALELGADKVKLIEKVKIRPITIEDFRDSLKRVRSSVSKSSLTLMEKWNSEYGDQNFSADVFLQDLWNAVTLEGLRDDLGAYLKVLRSAMIELINRDYADFVNLSGNLVGLDKAITNLKEPLSVICAEIQVVAKILDDAHSRLQFTLSERQSLREKRIKLECLIKIPSSLEQLEKLLVNTSLFGGDIQKLMEEDQSKGCVIERAANEFNHLQHLLVKCNSASLVISDFQKRSDQVNFNLMRYLEDTIMFGIENQKQDIVLKTLRTFFLLDQCKFVVNLLRIRLIRPAFRAILCPSSLKKEPQDLSGLLIKAKDFIRHNLKDLIEISGSFDGPNGFNLVTDCLWPEFYFALSDNMDCIFAQGNPDLLHKRYSCTMEFIDYLESLSSSTLHPLRKDPNYQSLIVRWNLPVYFQMRFQELAGSLETSLNKSFSEIGDPNKTAHFHSTEVLLSVLMSCFSPDIYLQPLSHRFLRLSLQMMARYQKKSLDILIEQTKRCEASSLAHSNSSAKLVDLEVFAAAHPTILTLEQLVMWHKDIRLILKELPQISNVASKQMELFVPKNQVLLFSSAFQTSCKGFEDLLPKLNQLIIGELSLQCTSHLKNVADIPRLYRRTNKETPTKCFGYVQQLLEPIRYFRSHYGHVSQTELYLMAVSDVLTIHWSQLVLEVITSYNGRILSRRRVKWLRQRRSIKSLSFTELLGSTCCAEMADKPKCREQSVNKTFYYLALKSMKGRYKKARLFEAGGQAVSLKKVRRNNEPRNICYARDG
uniref:Conserved oligomeric Golgi complex subunit 2 n=1 Tax=Alona affinis TaxID=381656 RepID=A0A9N6WQS1_9CRUS|nr:EOG090X03KZ [Alona affinis]